MKIGLFNVTTTTKTGGVESFVWELARYVSGLYPDCQIDIIGGQSPEQLPTNLPKVRIITRPFIPREQWRRLPILERLYGQTKLLERLTFGLACLPLLKNERYDILHIQKPYDLPLAQLAHQLWGTKILFGCHGKDFFPTDRLFVRGVEHAVSCSHYNASIVKAHYGIEPQVIYNGIDTDLFQPTPLDKELRLRYAKPDEFIVLQVGRQVRWKGAEYLIEALALLRQAHLPVTVLLAGDGTYRPTLEALAKHLEVTQYVKFLGNVPNDELPALYALADVIVGTSFANETFGIALCEAAACERPIVASDFGGFREVVQEGKTGFFYRPQDARDLADKLTMLLQDTTLREQFGKAGRQFVLQNFSWPAVAERVYNKYKEMLII